MLLKKQLDNPQSMFYISNCKYCGKPFIKIHNNHTCCSDSCRGYLLQNQKAAYQRKWRYDQKVKYPRINIPDISKCKYCGRMYVKINHRQKYCSEKCKLYAFQDQKAEYQRKRRKLINNSVLISNETRHVGTGFLSAHRNKDFDVEYLNIRKELNRVGVG